MKSLISFLSILLVFSVCARASIWAEVISPDGTLNLREKPNSSAKIVITVKNGVDVGVLTPESEWVLVTLEDKTVGYVKRKYLGELHDTDKSPPLNPGGESSQSPIISSKTNSNAQAAGTTTNSLEVAVAPPKVSSTETDRLVGTWRYGNASETIHLLVLEASGNFIYQFGKTDYLVPDDPDGLLTQRGVWYIDNGILICEYDGVHKDFVINSNGTLTEQQNVYKDKWVFEKMAQK